MESRGRWLFLSKEIDNFEKQNMGYMKRIVIFIISVLAILPTMEAQVKSCLSPDSTMVYEYHYEDSDLLFVLVSWVGAQKVLPEQFVEFPWWFHYEPKILLSHWATHGKKVDGILDKLGVEKRMLRVRLVYSLRTGELVTMRIWVNDDIAPLLNQLPLKEIFSIYETIETSQFITIHEHKPCEDDNKFILMDAICR